MIAAGSFREDLFYRLNVVPIQLPPLRERRDDVEALANHFLKLATQEGLPARQIDAAGLKLLQQHNWPGNVRELRNMMYRLIVLARDDVIDRTSVAEVLDDALVPLGENDQAGMASVLRAWLEMANPADGTIYHAAQSAFEKPLFEWALQRTDGNQVQAARLLGINRNTLRKRIVDLSIDAGLFGKG
jgi:two-component system nitrogen regulation response regulator GlnG